MGKAVTPWNVVTMKSSNKTGDTKMSNTVTAKTAISHVQGMVTVLKGARRLVKQFDGSTAQIDKKLANLEYVEATLVAQRASGKSGMTAGVSAGFVPYAD